MKQSEYSEEFDRLRETGCRCRNGTGVVSDGQSW